MNLYKRGEVYWIEYVQGGERHRISTHLRSIDAAKEVLRNMQSARDAGQRISRDEKPLKALDDILDAVRKLYNQCADDDLATSEKKDAGTPLTEVWNIYEANMDALGKRPKDATLYRRKNELTRFIKWAQKEYPAATSVQAVSGAIAMAYAIDLTRQKKSTKTRKNVIGELSVIWSLLKTNDIDNPWPRLAPRDTDGKIGEAFTRDEEAKVFEAAKKVGKDWYLVCKVMRHTGLRYVDVAKLRWDEIDFDDNLINRVPSKTERHGITVHIPLIRELQMLLGCRPHTDDYVFPVHAELHGNRGRASREALSFREVLTVAGINRAGLSVHSWRHTFNTRLAEAGIDKETRKRLSGHTQDATSDRYNHAKYYAADLKAIESAA